MVLFSLTASRSGAGVCLSFVSVAGALCALSEVHAQTPTSMPPIVVTASRTPMRVDQALADVTVIPREAIEQAGAQNLPQFLSQQAGVQVSSSGGLGMASSIFLRGMEARHTLLLIDGVRYGSATVGTPIWENLPLALIERIEIVRGPMSGLYGSDAVAGVIQVFTRKGQTGWHPHAALTVGTDQLRQTGAGVAFGQGVIDGAVDLQHTQTRGFSATQPQAPFDNYNPDRDGFHQDAASARLGLAWGSGWRADAHMMQSDGISQFDDGVGADARAKLRAQVAGVAVKGQWAPAWGTVLRLSRSADDYATIESSSPYSLGAVATVQRQFSWENTRPSPVGEVLVLAERVQQNVSRDGAPFAVSERTIDGVALGLQGQRDLHQWQANVRHDRNSQFGSQVSGAVGYGYQFMPAWRVAGSLGSSFVAPSFNQLYYPGFGNPNLVPEEGLHKELSLRWALSSQALKLTWFDNRIRGYISSGPAPVNVPRTQINGLSLSHSLTWGLASLETTIEHVDPHNVTPGANWGKQLPRRAQDSVKISGEVKQGAWQWGGVFNAYNQRFDDLANTVRVGGFATLDLRADWQVAREWRLGWRLNNVSDKRYETVYGYNQPGREAQMTLRYSGL